MKKYWFLILSLCLFLVWCSNTQEEFSMKEKCNQYNEDILEYATPNYTPNKYWAFYSSSKNTCLWYFFWTERWEATAVWTKLFDTLDRYIVVDLLSKKKLVDCEFYDWKDDYECKDRYNKATKEL